MDTTINVIAVLIATLLLAIAIDRGVPNSLDALAYWVERWSRGIVKLLRFSAESLRARHVSIEQAERERAVECPPVQNDYSRA